MKAIHFLSIACVVLWACQYNEKPAAVHGWADYFSNETYISTMGFDQAGALWMSYYYDTCSLRRFDRAGQVTYYNDTNADLLTDDFTLVWEDDERKIWQQDGLVVYYHTGIYQQYQPPYRYWSVYTTGEGARHKSSKIQVALDGTLWDANYLSIGYPYDGAPVGMRKFDGQGWTVFDTNNSPLPTNHVVGLCFDLAGNLLVSTLPPDGQAGVVMQYDGQQWTTLYTAPFTGYWIATMVVDTQGVLWMGELNRDAVGVDEGGGVLAWRDGQLTRFTAGETKLPSNSVVELTLDEVQNLWVGTYDGGLVRFDRKHQWKTINSDNSPMPFPNSVEHIRFDTEGRLWMAIQFLGLASFMP